MTSPENSMLYHPVEHRTIKTMILNCYASTSKLRLWVQRMKGHKPIRGSVDSALREVGVRVDISLLSRKLTIDVEMRMVP